MGKLRGCAKEACHVEWDEKEEVWILGDEEVCGRDVQGNWCWWDGRTYRLKAKKDTPIRKVIREALETTYLNPREITVDDPFYKCKDGNHWRPQRTYNRNGKLIDEDKSWTEFTETMPVSGENKND